MKETELGGKKRRRMSKIGTAKYERVEAQSETWRDGDEMNKKRRRRR